MTVYTMTGTNLVTRRAALAITGILLPFLANVHEAQSQPAQPIPKTRKQTDRPTAAEPQQAPSDKVKANRPAQRAATGQSTAILLRIEHDKDKNTDTVYVHFQGKKYTVADFIKGFTKLAEVVEPDESKRATITLAVSAERSVSAGLVQQIVTRAQSAGFERFALRAIPNAAQTPKHPRLKLLADFEGRLATVLLNRKHLGTGKTGFEALAKSLLADERITRSQPFDQLELSVDPNLVYAELIQVVDFVSKLRIPNSKTPVVKKLSFTVRGESPKVRGVVSSVKKLAKKSLIEISIGADDGLKTGQLLFVSRKNRTTKQPRFLGHIRIESVQPDKAIGVHIPNQKVDPINLGDQVSTRPPIP